MIVQYSNNGKPYLNAKDLDALYENRADKAQTFDEWLMQKYHKGDIANDKSGNYLTN